MTTKEFNRNIKAKVYGTDAEGKRINTLVGLGTLVNMFGDFAYKFIENFYESGLDKKQFKLRSKTYKVTNLDNAFYYVLRGARGRTRTGRWMIAHKDEVLDSIRKWREI